MSNLPFPTPTMSSREIAELTGKPHKHVIRDVRVMIDELEKDGPDLGHEDFQELKDARDYTAEFRLNRRLVEILVTGYSIPLRAKVIDRLHELESQPPDLPLYESVQGPIPLAELRQRIAALNEEQAALDRRQAVVWQTRADLAEALVILTGEERQALGVTDERLLEAPAPAAPTQIAQATRGASAWPARLNLSQRLAYGDMEKALFPDWFTPSELGESLGISGRYFNLLLMEAGLQTKQGETWIPTAAARGLCRWFGTGKKHLKWLRDVLAHLSREAA